MIARLTSQDWQAFRAIRLEALRLEPASFLSTLEREAVMTEADWRDRLAQVAVFAAGPDGIAGLRADGCVVMVYVRAIARGRGYARTLMEAIRTEAAAQAMPRLWLHVAKDNLPAQRLYASLGYSLQAEAKDDLVLSRTP